MTIITLTTDFGLKDPYVAQLKARLVSSKRPITVIDVSHEVAPYNKQQAAYILGSCFLDFPKNSIHIISVESGINDTNRPVIVEHMGHYFIGADNGFFSLILNGKAPDKVYVLESFNIKTSFPALEIFVPAALKLIDGIAITQIGVPTSQLVEVKELNVIVQEDSIMGNVIYIDNYQNAITNVDKGTFNQVFRSEPFEIDLRGKKMNQIFDSYEEIKIHAHGKNVIGQAVALFNQSGFLEIGLYKGNEKTGGGASGLLGLNYGTSFFIKKIK